MGIAALAQHPGKCVTGTAEFRRQRSQWQAAGEKDAAARANTIWKEQLAAYEDPGLDPDIDAALQDYIAARKAEKPDQDYF